MENLDSMSFRETRLAVAQNKDFYQPFNSVTFLEILNEGNTLLGDLYKLITNFVNKSYKNEKNHILLEFH